MDSDSQVLKVYCRSLASLQATNESSHDPCPSDSTSPCSEGIRPRLSLEQPACSGPHDWEGEDKNMSSLLNQAASYFAEDPLALSDTEMLLSFHAQTAQVGSDNRDDQLLSPVLSYSTISPVNAASPPSSVSSSPPRMRVDSVCWSQTEAHLLFSNRSCHIHNKGRAINTGLVFEEKLDASIQSFPRPRGTQSENGIMQRFNRFIYSSDCPSRSLQIQHQNAPQFLIFRKDESSCELVDPFYTSFRAPPRRKPPPRLEKRNTVDPHELALEREWEAYFDLGRRKNVSFLAFLDHVHFVCSFNTVEGFWRFFNNLPDMSRMPKYFNLRVVPADVQPVQSDSSSIGGKIVITGKNIPRVLNDIWLRCCLSLIGETMNRLDVIDSVILAMRPDRGRINLRIVNKMEIEAIEELMSKLRDNLEFDSSIRIHHVPNDR